MNFFSFSWLFCLCFLCFFLLTLSIFISVYFSSNGMNGNSVSDTHEKWSLESWPKNEMLNVTCFDSIMRRVACTYAICVLRILGHITYGPLVFRHFYGKQFECNANSSLRDGHRSVFVRVRCACALASQWIQWELKWSL